MMRHMEETGFLNSVKIKIIAFLREYKAELLLISMCMAVTAISLYLFIDTLIHNPLPIPSYSTARTMPETKKIVVDISGGVNKPDVYNIEAGKRISDVINAAGGLSDNADMPYIQRNINLARLVIDQDKIHIPTKTETKDDIIVENPQYIDYTSGRTQQQVFGKTTIQKVDINLATKDQLLGVDGLTEKIVDNILGQRPFTTTRDLVTQKIMTKTAFDKVSPYLTLTPL